MRFFTMEWWGGVQRPAASAPSVTEPFARYQAHLAAIDPHIPPALRSLHDHIPLHDARLRTFTYRAARSALTIGLENWFPTDEMRRFYFHYTAIVAIDSSADPTVGLLGPYGYGDLGYDEIDRGSDGTLIHRLLFSSGIELHITFHAFALLWMEPQELDS
jgi:hypothetical protein